MPSPRSVLIDITAHGLDPKVPHSNFGADGRLRPHPPTELAPKKKTPRLGLVELPVEEVKIEFTDEDVSEQPPADATSAPEEASEDAPSKPKKQAQLQKKKPVS